MKKHTLTWWKKKTWKLCSEYIRRKNADKYGMVCCVTCGIVKHWKQMQAGHYVDGHGNAVMFDDRLIHPQCFRCNAKMPGCLAGNKIKYTDYLMKTYGYTFEQCLDFDNLKFVIKKYTIVDYKNLIIEYEKKLAEVR